jgi:hypothetical protein
MAQAITLDDLIAIAEGQQPSISATSFRLDIQALFGVRRILEPLKKLQAMVGMKSVKETIVGHILFFLQGLHEGSDDMLHLG